MKVLSKLQRYGLAVISCGIALPVAWPIDAPASCFLLAVMVTSLFGGLGPGLLSVALSAITYEHFFLRRITPPAHEPAALLRFTVFLTATLLVTGLLELKRRAEQSRTRAEDALRQAQTDLAHANRVTAMGELTASLAHEVNQPIAAAVTDANTCLRWLTRDEPDLEEARQAASRVVKDAARAPDMINSIQAMRDVSWPRQLAVKSQWAEDEQLMVSVSDTGVGLPAQQADQVFDAFFTTKRDGTGMGLRISRSIVESHGGRMWAGDNSPHGASFHLTLPSKAES